MTDFLYALILGLVQGFTEFLPISSTGHLIITSSLLNLSGDRINVFEVVIQFGSILAVVVLYFSRFWGLLFPRKGIAFSGIRGLYLLFLTSLPASFVGLIAHSFIQKHLFNPVSVAMSLAVGAIFILWVETRKVQPTCTSVDAITPRLALGIGCFQCLSVLWPGFSRSASTIMGAMVLGARRDVATEYSFMAAVPIMFAATTFSLYKASSILTMNDLPFFLTGTIVSFFAALLAIKWLISLVSRMSFKPFAWYRLIIAPIILWVWL